MTFFEAWPWVICRCYWRKKYFKLINYNDISKILVVKPNKTKPKNQISTEFFNCFDLFSQRLLFMLVSCM